MMQWHVLTNYKWQYIIVCHILEPYEPDKYSTSLTLLLFPDILQLYTSPHHLHFLSPHPKINCTHHHTSSNLTFCSAVALLSHNTSFDMLLFPSKLLPCTISVRKWASHIFWFRPQSLTQPFCGLLRLEDGGSARNRFSNLLQKLSVCIYVWVYECVMSVVCFDADQRCVRWFSCSLSASCGVGRAAVQIQKPLYLSHCSPLKLSSEEDSTWCKLTGISAVMISRKTEKL